MKRLPFNQQTQLTESRWGPRSTWRCSYCGRSCPDGAVDHFVPLARGGTSLPWNMVPCCPVCNRSKGDHAPDEWMRAVGLPEATIAAVHSATRPTWSRPANPWPSFHSPDYPAAHGLRDPAIIPGLPVDLDKVFSLDPDSWAPTTALRRIAADYLADLGRPPLSSQQLNRILRSRGLHPTTRKGKPGYRGFHVSAELAASGRLTAGRTQAAASRRLNRFLEKASATLASET